MGDNKAVADLAAVNVLEDDLVLRFAAGRFRDVYVRDLRTSPQGSDGGTIKVRQWTEDEVARFYVLTDRYSRYGRPVAWLITRAHRRVGGNGLVQWAARRGGVPLSTPSDRSAIITGCMVVGADTGMRWAS